MDGVQRKRFTDNIDFTFIRVENYTYGQVKAVMFVLL